MTLECLFHETDRSGCQPEKAGRKRQAHPARAPPPHCIDCMHTLRFILLPLSDCYCASNAHHRKQLIPHQYLKVSRDAVVNKDSNDTPCVTASSRPACASPLQLCPKLQARFDRLLPCQISADSVYVVGVTQGWRSSVCTCSCAQPRQRQPSQASEMRIEHQHHTLLSTA